MRRNQSARTRTLRCRRHCGEMSIDGSRELLLPARIPAACYGGGPHVVHGITRPPHRLVR
jgi:hypothetical protein